MIPGIHSLNLSFRQGFLKTGIWLFCALYFSGSLLAQALPIAIDSRFEDWNDATNSITDPSGDGNSIDFLKVTVANDEQFLFFELELAQDLNLIENNQLNLYLDTDMNASTGQSVNGIGADLIIRTGEKEAYYNIPGNAGYLSLNEIGFRHQPTVTGNRFEIAISRDAATKTGVPLFSGTGCRYSWKDEKGFNGDEIPDDGQTASYFFDNTAVAMPPSPPLEKENGNFVRLLTWNTLNSGLDDITREPYFRKVLSVLEPDIVTFNECWDLDAPQVASFMNAAVPLGNFQSWKAVKLDQGNITASRYPILQNWLIFPGHRLTASLIDIPGPISSTDLLVVNGHFKCCSDGDYDRQREADAFIEFILDAQKPGGVIDLPEGTPFLLSGDLNLVGDKQQLQTLLTGETINTAQFGPGGPPDWDGTDLEDVISIHSDDRLSYTWRNDNSSFPPSRLDFQILSNSVATVEKTYSLETRSMSQARLDLYGLSASDVAKASDHIPKVLDLSLPLPLDVRNTISTPVSAVISPNPVSGLLQISIDTEIASDVQFRIQDATGKIWEEWSAFYPGNGHLLPHEVAGLPDGLYFLQFHLKDQTGRISFVVIQNR